MQDASVSDFETTHLETRQRDLARAIAGIPAAAPSAATLLEANLLPASVVIPAKVVAHMERWRRLPPDDLRNKLINRPPAHTPSQPVRSGSNVFPAPIGFGGDCAQRSPPTYVSPVHPHIPLLLHRRTAPHQTTGLSKVFIYPTADGAPSALPDKDTPDGAKLCKELNYASWHAIQHRHGPFTAEVWTDGGVLHAEQPECLSTAAGHLYLAHSPAPVASFATSAGRLSCSYTTEFTAMLGICFGHSGQLHHSAGNRLTEAATVSCQRAPPNGRRPRGPPMGGIPAADQTRVYGGGPIFLLSCGLPRPESARRLCSDRSSRIRHRGSRCRTHMVHRHCPGNTTPFMSGLDAEGQRPHAQCPSGPDGPARTKSSWLEAASTLYRNWGRIA